MSIFILVDVRDAVSMYDGGGGEDVVVNLELGKFVMSLLSRPVSLFSCFMFCCC